MPELRHRQTAAKPEKVESPQRRRSSDNDNDEGRGISLLDMIRVVVTLIVASCGLSYYMTSTESMLWGYRPWFTRWPVVKQWVNGPVNLTPAQLSLYTGTDATLPLYVAVNGTIYDVSENRMIYGPGGSYNFFAGRDATRAFVTGCFKDDLTADIRGVETMFVPVDDVVDEAITSAQKKIRREKELRTAKGKVEATVQRWQNFFANHKKYFEVGKVVNGTVEGEEWPLCASAEKQRPKRSAMKEES